MDQQFLLGVTAGFFIITTLFLLYLSFIEWWKRGVIDTNKRIINSGILSYIQIPLVYGIALLGFIGSFFYLINFNTPPNNLSSTAENYFIFQKNSFGKRIIIILIYLFELAVMFIVVTFIKVKPKENSSSFVKASLFFCLTYVFVCYNLFMCYTDNTNPENYSSIALGGVGIFITLFIAVLTFKDE